MSNGIGEGIGFNWKLAVGLLVAWLIIFLCLIKGIQSLGKVSYITALFPYVMLASLIVRGVTLPGSMKGLVYFIGTIDFDKLISLKVNVEHLFSTTKKKQLPFLTILSFAFLRHGLMLHHKVTENCHHFIY